MSRRALAEKRPWLLASLAAAMAYSYLRGQPWPELYLMPVKGSAVALLAIYLWQRHSGADARMMAGALGLAALADAVAVIDPAVARLFFFGYHVLALGVYLRNRRPDPSPSQRGAAATLLLVTPIVAWLLPAERAQAPGIALYALALGGMAAAAWASAFPRYRVGLGAVLVLLADLLLFAGMGPMRGHPWLGLAWPLYYLGQLLVAVGLAQALRKHDADLHAIREH